jgi:hypothetical protein
MTPKAPWARWLIALSCACLLVSSLSLLHAREDSVERFYFSSDPQLKLLVADFLGTATGLGTSYTLYADGRLEINDINYKMEKVGTTLVHVLTHQEVSRLIQEAVDANLLEWNKERIQGEMRKAENSPYIVSDGATVRLQINLEKYRKSDKEDFGPASVRIVFSNPTIVAARYPRIDEIQSLATIAKTLRRYKQMAVEVSNEK